MEYLFQATCRGWKFGDYVNFCFVHHDTRANPNKKPKVTCWKCGKPGHLKKDCKGGNVGNRANGSSTKGSEDGSSNPLKGQSMFNKSHQIYYVTYVSEAFFVQDDDVAWWVDSGATVHVCKDRCWFKTYESLNDGSILHMGNESTTLVHGRGCVDLRFSSGKVVSLLNVLHVPNIRKNLVSSSVLNNCGYKQVIESNKFVLSKHGVFIGFGYLSNHMFRLNIVSDNIGSAFMSTSKLNDSILWHARLGHVHFKRMQDMSKDGLIPAFDMDTEKCQTCMLNKITKKPFQNVKRETEVLELIHSDLCDLHATPSLGNKKYFVIFIDDASRKNNHKKKTKTNTDTGTSSVSESDAILSDATPRVDVAKKVVSPYVVDETVATEKLSPVVNTTNLGSNPPLHLQETTSAGNAPEDVGTVPVWVKLHGVPVTAFNEDGLSAIATKLGTPLMLDSYTFDMCMQSRGRSSYARAMIELRADVEFKDNIVAVIPKITGEGNYTCNICVEYEWKPLRCACCKVFGHVQEECPKNTGTDETKNMKKTSRPEDGI
ncbi:zinc finger, CCHC-type containing protein [Tanacetum coccineum]